MKTDSWETWLEAQFLDNEPAIPDQPALPAEAASPAQAQTLPVAEQSHSPQSDAAITPTQWANAVSAPVRVDEKLHRDHVFTFEPRSEKSQTKSAEPLRDITYYFPWLKKEEADSTTASVGGDNGPTETGDIRSESADSSAAITDANRDLLNYKSSTVSAEIHQTRSDRESTPPNVANHHALPLTQPTRRPSRTRTTQRSIDIWSMQPRGLDVLILALEQHDPEAADHSRRRIDLTGQISSMNTSIQRVAKLSGLNVWQVIEEEPQLPLEVYRAQPRPGKPILTEVFEFMDEPISKSSSSRRAQ